MQSAATNDFLAGLLAALQRPGTSQFDDNYLYGILGREAVDTSILSPAYQVRSVLQPALTTWGHCFLLDVTPSGSFAKGTANKSGTDLDLFISVSPDTPSTLSEICDTLANQVRMRGYAPRRQNVSIGVTVSGLKVDLVPGRLQAWGRSDHSLYHRKSSSWRKTNVAEHIRLIQTCGRQSEIRLIKLWRDQHGLEFPSFYLELAVIEALRTSWVVSLSSCVLRVLEYLSTDFVTARFVDPANTNNIISDDLTAAQKQSIGRVAGDSLRRPWSSILR